MNSLYYKKRTAVNLKRVLPRVAESCKLSVYSNACNHFGFEKKYNYRLTPELFLDLINKHRQSKIQGSAKLNPLKDIIPTTDIDIVVRKFKLFKTKCYSGNSVNYAFIKKCISSGKLVALYHQMYYFDPKFLKDSYVIDLHKNSKFSDKKLHKYVRTLIDFYGPFDLGHIDIVLDVFKKNGKSRIVLANLATKENKHPIILDWDVFSKYNFFDWFSDKVIYSPIEIPSGKYLKKLKKTGCVSFSDKYFMWNSTVVFEKREQ